MERQRPNEQVHASLVLAAKYEPAPVPMIHFELPSEVACWGLALHTTPHLKPWSMSKKGSSPTWVGWFELEGC